MNKSIRAPFPWFGGKGNPKIKKAILELLPPHDYYVEPFGGGASILMAKAPADVEYFGKFMARAALLPLSRELYEEFLRTWPAIHDPVEQAVRWYYVARQSFGGIFGQAWGAGITTIGSHWRSSFDNLPLVHERMQGVQIECSDWRDVLARFNGPGYLAYCDPPYVLGARKSGGYAHELQDDDHEDLVAALLEYQGAVVLSGYDSELYRPLDQAGWHCTHIDVVCMAAARTRVSGLQGVGKAKAKQGRVECIWRNPEAIQRLSQ